MSTDDYRVLDRVARECLDAAHSDLNRGIELVCLHVSRIENQTLAVDAPRLRWLSWARKSARH
jgi:hypothetical protein